MPAPGKKIRLLSVIRFQIDFDTHALLLGLASREIHVQTIPSRWSETKHWKFWLLITFFLQLDGNETLYNNRNWKYKVKTEVNIFVTVIVSMVMLWQNWLKVLQGFISGKVNEGIRMTFGHLLSLARNIPGEPKSGGHVTITHQMLASTFWVFSGISLSQSDKKCGENLCKTFLAYSENSWYFISHLFSQQMKGRNESHWSIFSCWFTGREQICKFSSLNIGTRPLFAIFHFSNFELQYLRKYSNKKRPLNKCAKFHPNTLNQTAEAMIWN